MPLDAASETFLAIIRDLSIQNAQKAADIAELVARLRQADLAIEGLRLELDAAPKASAEAVD